MPRIAKDPEKRKVAARLESKRRVAGIEAPHTMWIRNDLWILLKERKLETGQKLAHMLNEALFDYLMRKKIEKDRGMKTEFDDTEFKPEVGTVIKR